MNGDWSNETLVFTHYFKSIVGPFLGDDCSASIIRSRDGLFASLVVGQFHVRFRLKVVELCFSHGQPSFFSKPFPGLRGNPPGAISLGCIDPENVNLRVVHDKFTDQVFHSRIELPSGSTIKRLPRIDTTIATITLQLKQQWDDERPTRHEFISVTARLLLGQDDTNKGHEQQQAHENPHQACSKVNV